MSPRAREEAEEDVYLGSCGHPRCQQQRVTEAAQGRSNDLKLAGIVALGKLLKLL